MTGRLTRYLRGNTISGGGHQCAAKMVTWCLTVLWVCCALSFPSTLTFARSGQRTGYELDGACCTHSSSVFVPAGISPLARSSLSWLLLVRRRARLVEGENATTHTQQQLTLLCL